MSSLDDLVNILKAVSQSSRLQILIYSLHKSRSFQELMQNTNIQKTALNVHLNQLIEQKLLEKQERGIYRTTILGEELIRVSALILKDAHLRKIIDQGRMNIQGYYKEGVTTMKKLISDKILYQDAMLSYIGSVTGVMQYYGLPVTVDDIAGYSGYSFLLNMAEVFTCPSGPTAHPSNVWEQVHKGTECLGATINIWFENESFPETEFAVSSRDQKRSKILFEKVKSIIDVSNQPVIIWGIPVPEYGIVKGFEENSYLVSTFRHLIHQPDSPIKYDALQAPGCLEMITLVPNDKKNDEESKINALKRIITFATGNYKPTKGYKVGLEALDTWIEHLKQDDPKFYPYHGNSYLGSCTLEAFQFSTSFLKKIGTQLQNDGILQSAKYYDQAASKMADFSKIFPFAFEGEIGISKRKDGVRILSDVKIKLEKAIDHLKNSV